MSILRTDKIAGLDSVSAITGSVFFGGQGSLRGPKDDDFQFASGGDFTIEAWVNASHFDSNSTIAATWDQTGAANGDQWLLTISDAGLLRFAWSPERTDDYFITGGTITKDTWHHVALTRSGNTFQIFLDGTQTATGTNSSTNSANSFLQIGRYAEVSTSYWYGYISNLRICKGHAVYKKAFTPPTRQLTVHFNSPGDETVLLCCQSSQDAGMDATGKILTPTVTTVNSAAPKPSTFVPDVGNDHTHGTVLEGGTAFSSLNYLTLPRGTTTQSNRGRGLFAGAGPSFSKEINYIQIQSQGNTTKFGDLTTATADVQGGSSSTRGLFGAGGGSGSPGFVNTIEYVTIATTANATDFGDLNETTFQGAALANDTRYVYGGGTTPTVKDVIDYVTIATTGDATDFGNLTVGRFALTAFGSPTRGIYAGGASPTIVNTIDYITIASTGDAIDFGDVTSEDTRNPMGASSSTRGVIAGGQTNAPSTGTDAIDFLTIATTGNTTDFGNLTDGRRRGSGLSNSIRGVFTGGYDPAVKNTIDYITIATTGNAQDFGDYSGDSIRRLGTSASDSHGGLS